VRRFPFLEHDGLLAFAHRGGAGDWPENTMLAFQGAVDLGFSYVETDAYATADGVVLAFHDAVLDRVTDRKGPVADLDYEQVAKARVGGREPIPLLAELLTSWPHLKVNIDPKHDSVVEPLIDLIRQTGCIDRVCIGSFSGRRLRACREALGINLCTSMGPWETARLRLKSLGVGVRRFGAACAQVPVSYHGIGLLDAAFVATAHDLGRPVHVWTIDTEAEMDRLIDLGVDGLMTDRPALLKKVLQRRGLWARSIPAPDA